LRLALAAGSTILTLAFVLALHVGSQQTLRVLAIAVVDQARDKKEYRFDKPENFASYEVRLAPQQSICVSTSRADG